MAVASKSASLQDQFLNAARRSRRPVRIFITKGAKLEGPIKGFDAFSLLLRGEGHDQLVYKHSISTVMPSGPLDGFVPAPPADELAVGLQDQFLAEAATAGTSVGIFLVNGVLLEGLVTGFDQYCLTLKRGRTVQLVYKHAISSVQTARSMSPAPQGDGAVRQEVAV